MSYLEAQTWRCDELSARRSMHFVGKCPVRLGVVVWSPFSRAAAGGKFVSYHVCASRKRLLV